MTRPQILKSTTWSAIREYLLIAIGTMMYAAAWRGFFLPHGITSGGATGIGAVVQYGTGFPIHYTYFLLNLVLIAISLWKLGLQFSLRTIYGVACLTFFLRIIPTADTDTFVNANEPFMACVLGGVLAASGMALIFLNNGSSGGTDIIAKIMNKYYANVTLGRALLYCDILIISSTYFLPEGNLPKIVYGLTAMVIITFTLDMLVNGVRQSVQFFIFSAHYDEIANAINSEVHRGVTILDGMGWYSKQPIKVVTVLARKHESQKIFKIVKEIDPNAFVSQSSAIGVYGQGFDVMKTK